MSRVVHIVQRDSHLKNIESTIIDIVNISKLNCVYPSKDEENKEENDDFQEGVVVHDESLVEILLSNGEAVNIDLSTPTLFRILREEGRVDETTKLQKFEEMYLSALTDDLVEI